MSISAANQFLRVPRHLFGEKTARIWPTAAAKAHDAYYAQCRLQHKARRVRQAATQMTATALTVSQYMPCKAAQAALLNVCHAFPPNLSFIVMTLPKPSWKRIHLIQPPGILTQNQQTRYHQPITL